MAAEATGSRVHKTLDEKVWGVHHNTARVACGILAGNCFHTPYFALDQYGVFGVDLGPEDLLIEKEYYFIIPGNLASFRDWIFPHEDLEDIWPHDPASRNDLHCSITGDWGVAVALVPETEEHWYISNGMTVSRPKSRDQVDADTPMPLPIPIHSRGNTIYLKPSLHKHFHAGSFTIVPKLTLTGMEYVMTVLSNYAEDPEEPWALFNGKPARPFYAGSKRQLFARFGWTVFVHSNSRIGFGPGDEQDQELNHPYT
ncbi:uncharacterized protein TrAtP1_012925 [Trichoderma atroviride]|uniref:uncharacterized protein n=1 Tax=Hypocrea atroviridis TaxID=63577 RepID=UPI00331D4E70|nr:hypothetical protein TrAtP1_012925 [Trichoderma atroviride]